MQSGVTSTPETMRLAPANTNVTLIRGFNGSPKQEQFIKSNASNCVVIYQNNLNEFEQSIKKMVFICYDSTKSDANNKIQYLVLLCILTFF
jgi:hypothetical protein